MTERELKKLNRVELLELLISQMKANEALMDELEAMEQELEDRRLNVESLGSIAEASLKINGVFEAAEAAAAQYIENVRELCSQSVEASRAAAGRAQKIIEEAELEAENIINEAWQEAELIRSGRYTPPEEYYEY